jgi:hypothetical protein
MAAMFWARWLVVASRRAEGQAARIIHSRRSGPPGGAAAATALLAAGSGGAPRTRQTANAPNMTNAT